MKNTFTEEHNSFVMIDHTCGQDQNKRRTSLGQIKRYKISRVSHINISNSSAFKQSLQATFIKNFLPKHSGYLLSISWIKRLFTDTLHSHLQRSNQSQCSFSPASLPYSSPPWPSALSSTPVPTAAMTSMSTRKSRAQPAAPKAVLVLKAH